MVSGGAALGVAVGVGGVNVGVERGVEVVGFVGEEEIVGVGDCMGVGAIVGVSEGVGSGVAVGDELLDVIVSVAVPLTP